MEFIETHLKKSFVVNKVMTLHYFEFEKDYAFKGAKHNFWEMVYVDKGEVYIDMGTDVYRLKQGNIAFHQPNEYHNLRANGVIPPNVIIISFVCTSSAMDFFKRKILPLSDIEKGFLATIVKEAARSFSSSLNDVLSHQIVRRADAMFGSEQMISIAIEQLLISLYRTFGENKKNNTTLKRGIQQDVTNNILQFLQDNIHRKLTLQEVADAIGISRTGASTNFKDKTGESVMIHFSKMKMDVAKTMIREGKYNVSQIASNLGFETIHLFSRRFKQLTGMTPTEYMKSVKVDFEHAQKNRL